MNNIYAINATNTQFMTNPTPKSDIRRVDMKDGLLNPLIEEHKQNKPGQITIFG